MAIPSSFLRMNRLFSDLAVYSSPDSPHWLSLPTFFRVMNRGSVAAKPYGSGLAVIRWLILLYLCFLAEGLPSNLVWSGLRLRNLLEDVPFWLSLLVVVGSTAFDFPATCFIEHSAMLQNIIDVRGVIRSSRLNEWRVL